MLSQVNKNNSCLFWIPSSMSRTPLDIWEMWICHGMSQEFFNMLRLTIVFFFLSERQALQELTYAMHPVKIKAWQILQFVQELLLRDVNLLYKMLINSIYLKYLCQLKINHPFVKVMSVHFLWDMFNFCTHCRCFNMSLLETVILAKWNSSIKEDVTNNSGLSIDWGDGQPTAGLLCKVEIIYCSIVTACTSGPQPLALLVDIPLFFLYPWGQR